LSRKSLTTKSKKDYIFAVDKTNRPTQKRLVKSISNGIGTGQFKNFTDKEISNSIIWKDFLMIDLKMKSSDVFKDLEWKGEEEASEE